jgi:hypothetical protein
VSSRSGQDAVVKSVSSLPYWESNPGYKNRKEVKIM